MCGIAGFISSKPLSGPVVQSLCKALLFYSQDRGAQSAGLFLNNTLLKRAVSAEELYHLPEFHALFGGPSSMALLHTRQPTTGDRGDGQAQPFIVPRTNNKGVVISVHNGVVTNYQALATEHGVSMPSGVDSELFPQVVAKKGIAFLPHLMRSAYGNHAVAMIYGNRLYICRDGNPIEYMTIHFTDDVKVTVFASTEDIVLRAARFVWLLSKDFKTKPAITRQLYQVTPNGLREIGEPVAYGTVAPIAKGHDPFFVPKNGWNHTRPRPSAVEKKNRKEVRIVTLPQDYDSHGWPDRDSVSGNGDTPPGSHQTHLQRLHDSFKPGVSVPIGYPGIGTHSNGTVSGETASEDLTAD